MLQAEEKAKEFVKSLEGLSATFMYEKIEKKVKELEKKLFYYEGAICSQCHFKHCIDDSECPSCGLF